jgi:type IV secretory pathway VirJ component
VFRFPTTALGPVVIREAVGPRKGVAFLFLADVDAEPTVQILAENGYFVVRFDVAELLKRLGTFRSASDCLYLPGPLENISQTIQGEFRFGRYRPPVLLGNGVGASVVYAAMAQAPPLAFAGGVSIDFSRRLPLRRPLCGVQTRYVGNEQLFAAEQPLRGTWRIAGTQAISAAVTTFKRVADATNGVNSDRAPVVAELPLLSLNATQEVRSPIASTSQPIIAMTVPVVEVTNTSSRKVLAIIYSGDGGWRDLDQTLGDLLKDRGFAVLGVDALRYFWSKRTPEEISRDLDALISHYQALWGTEKTLLIGYSFGAEILPFAYNRLPLATKTSVALISLICPEQSAEFEIHVLDWVVTGGTSESLPLLPEVTRINPNYLQCIYGQDEAEASLCTKAELQSSEIVKRPGGHHFDYNYEPVADAIAQGMDRRLVSAPRQLMRAE